jgi:putative photosynthetic complex assembly protein
MDNKDTHMQHTATKPQPDQIPRVPLMAAIGLVCVVVLAVAAARLAGVPATPGAIRDVPLQSRLLSFEDAKDGSIVVHDVTSGDTVAVAGPGTNGFLRGSLRGLMRVRKQEEIAPLTPYKLELMPNGQLVLEDTANAMQIDLNAFGHTNAAVFKAFLDTKGGNAP